MQHIVLVGESLNQIAIMYKTQLYRLMFLNPHIRNPNRIYPGQIIKVR